VVEAKANVGACPSLVESGRWNSVDEDLLTGERTWPGIERENYWFARHLACYRWAAGVIGEMAGTGPILDAGSGEGYGAAEVAGTCAQGVVALELDGPTARHARGRYPHLSHIRANLIALPFSSCAFAAAVSLQVVEHIWDPIAYLRELARCTHGPVIISTPNRPVHSPGLRRGELPNNPFHVREFDASELTELLAQADARRTAELFGLQHGVRVRTWEGQRDCLPTLLLENQHDSDVSAFAKTISADDFSITRIDAHSENPSVHDLIAIW
jgi:SAM-dependent methyltransferase